MSWYDPDRVSERSRYLTAEVCRNGHVSTPTVEHSPGLTAKFCAECGAETMRTCPQCSAAIRGKYYVPTVASNYTYHPPNHCHNCGTAFPWTVARLEAAKEYAAELEGLDEAERKQLRGAISDLSIGGARTELAASRFKRLMAKAGQTVGGGLYKIVVDVLSDAAKKAIVG